MSINNQLLKHAVYINFYIDKLTFLGNRELLKKVLNNREEKLLLYIDIKDFGSINEAYGEDFGNIVLNELSINIKKDFFDFDIYRAGGDIFALLLKEGSSNYSSSQIENKVHQFFLKPFIVRNEEINLCSTVALVKGCNNVLNKAEITLREAKQNKKNFLEYNKLFAVQRKSKYDEYKVLMNKIVTAIKEDRIYPVYQPIFSRKKEKLYSFP
jgi:diguanylate cyclase (GGDEF)-like protein